MRLQKPLVRAALLFALAGFLSPEASGDEAPAVTLDTGGKAAVGVDDGFEVVLSRPLTPAEGRLAVLVDNEDRTDLLVPSPRGLKHPARRLPLGPGERQVGVYRVADDGTWIELAKLPLRVRTRSGLDTFEIAPKVDLNFKGTLGTEETPEPAPGASRGTFQDVAGQVDLRLAATRGAFSFGVAANVQGSSYENEALRYGTEGEDAPKVDLSSYQVTLKHASGARLEMGHVSWGQHRHMATSFASRGLVAVVPIGRAVELSGAALSTTNIVGWDNVSGVSVSQNRVFAGQLALELVPSRPGAVRLEGLISDGSRLPLTSFNAGQVTDAEESRGEAARLASSLFDGRLRLDAGWARSRFVNPSDPLLDQGTDLVAVKETTRNARYAEVSGDLLRGMMLAGRMPLTVTVALKHERVDPLYRTVVATPQADLEQNALEALFQLGSLSVQAVAGESEDNLAALESVLKTKTRRTGTTVAFPLAAVFSKADGNPRTFLPAVSWAFQRVHAAGASIPNDPAYSASAVPDQVNLAHVGALDWTFGAVRTGYRLTLADQDNRQPGRERADFLNTGHGLAFGLATTRFDLALDGNLERAENEEQPRVDTTERLGLIAGFRPLPGLAFAGIVQASRTKNDTGTAESHARSYELTGTYRIERRVSVSRALAAQLLLRWALRENDSKDTVFATSSDARTWLVSSVVTLSFF